MEIFELKYFLAVASFENVHRASEKLRVSPGSLSKAIARLEDELRTKLFSREGRNIRLTEAGKLLQVRASTLAQWEEATRLEITGQLGQLHVVLSGPEVLLAKMGADLTANLQKRYSNATFEYHAVDEERALAEVATGDAHLAIVTGDVPSPLTSKILNETHFVTVVGPGHELFAHAKGKKAVPIGEVLKHAFVSPSRPILGKVGAKQSWDGWRDDEFARKVSYLTSSLKLLETFVSSGRALAYLPDYFLAQLQAQNAQVLELKVTGCPYTCVQKVKLVARKPKNTGWLNQLF